MPKNMLKDLTNIYNEEVEQNDAYLHAYMYIVLKHTIYENLLYTSVLAILGTFSSVIDEFIQVTDGYFTEHGHFS